jgi:asparagine synthase (glutamine-hydrolysing)
MCGILFCNWKEKSQINKKILYQSLNLLKNRGPDNSKLIFSENWSMGHTRLSIIDPNSTKSNQPFTDEEGRYFLTFNGEIYNFKELKLNLVSRGFKFRTNSDTEVLYILLKNFAIQSVLNLIKGMFAFVFFDKKDNSFIAARDHFGQKPLYYSINNSMVAISSSVKSLNKIINSSPDIDLYNIYLSSNGIINQKKTFFKNIKCLQAGNYIYGKNFLYKDHKYFHPEKLYSDEKRIIQKKNSETESIQNLKFLMKQSVSRHLVSDVKVGILLSGGIDSSLLYYFAHLENKDLSSFTSLSPNIEKNSFRLVPKIINKFPVKKNFFVTQDKNRYLQELTFLIENTYTPPRWGGGPPMSKLCEKARKNKIKVLIGGDGVDEISGGYNTMIDCIRKKNLSKLSTHQTLTLNLPTFIKKNKYYHQFEKHINNERKNIANKLGKIKNYKERIINSLLIQDAGSFLQMCTLPHSDEYSMFNSVELRNPYLDLDLVEYIINEPIEHKINTSKTKILFKKLAVQTFGKFIDSKKEGTRNYSKYISNTSFWDLKKFKVFDALKVNKTPDVLSYKLLYKLICLEIFHRSIVLNEKNFFKEILSKQGINTFKI